MRLEITREAVQAGKSTSSEKNNDHSKKRKNGDRRPSPDKTNKKARALDLRVSWPPPSKYINYTDLIASREDVFLAAEQSGVFKRRDPLHGDRSKKNQNKYCRSHKDIDHTTEEYISLKDEIEKLIRCEYL